MDKLEKAYEGLELLKSIFIYTMLFPGVYDLLFCINLLNQYQQQLIVKVGFATQNSPFLMK